MKGYKDCPEDLPGCPGRVLRLVPMDRGGGRFRAVCKSLVEEKDIPDEMFERGILILPRLKTTFTGSQNLNNAVAEVTKSLFCILHNWYDQGEDDDDDATG